MALTEVSDLCCVINSTLIFVFFALLAAHKEAATQWSSNTTAEEQWSKNRGKEIHRLTIFIILGLFSTCQVEWPFFSTSPEIEFKICFCSTYIWNSNNSEVIFGIYWVLYINFWQFVLRKNSSNKFTFITGPEGYFDAIVYLIEFHWDITFLPFCLFSFYYPSTCLICFK